MSASERPDIGLTVTPLLDECVFQNEDKPNTWRDVACKLRRSLDIAECLRDQFHSTNFGMLQSKLLRQVEGQGEEPELRMSLEPAFHVLVSASDTGFQVFTEKDLTNGSRFFVENGKPYNESKTHAVFNELKQLHSKKRQTPSGNSNSITASSLFKYEKWGINEPDFTAVRSCQVKNHRHSGVLCTVEVKSLSSSLDEALAIRDYVYRVRKAAHLLSLPESPVGTDEEASSFCEDEKVVLKELQSVVDVHEDEGELRRVSNDILGEITGQSTRLSHLLGSITGLPEMKNLRVQPKTPAGGPSLAWKDLAPPPENTARWRATATAYDRRIKARIGLAQEFSYALSAHQAFGACHGMLLVGSKLARLVVLGSVITVELDAEKGVQSVDDLFSLRNLYDLFPHDFLLGERRVTPIQVGERAFDWFNFDTAQVYLNCLASAFVNDEQKTSECVKRPRLLPLSDVDAMGLGQKIEIRVDDDDDRLTLIKEARPKLAKDVGQLRSRKRKPAGGSGGPQHDEAEAGGGPSGGGNGRGGAGGGAGGAGEGGEGGNGGSSERAGGEGSSGGQTDGTGGTGGTGGGGTGDTGDREEDGVGEAEPTQHGEAGWSQASPQDIDDGLPLGADAASFAGPAHVRHLKQLISELKKNGVTIRVVSPGQMDSILRDALVADPVNTPSPHTSSTSEASTTPPASRRSTPLPFLARPSAPGPCVKRARYPAVLQSKSERSLHTQTPFPGLSCTR